jgi:galactokinase
MGAGLSSSAALEVAILKGLSELSDLGLDPVRVAVLGQRVENEFVGARVGIMDQMESSLGNFGEALFIDTRHMTYKVLPLLSPKMELLVINSGIKHSHASGEYNQRRKECEKACELLGVRELRDLTMSDLPRLNELPTILRRRARHVITENTRVLEAVRALERHEFRALGELFNLSHLSMRDDFEVSIPQIDALVEICQAQSKVFGARMTGGGFGGSIVALVHGGASMDIGEKVVAEYRRRTGFSASILVPLPSEDRGGHRKSEPTPGEKRGPERGLSVKPFYFPFA